ncbi:TPA: glycosyltransferase, partial [Kluyvera georgiana]
LNLSRVSGLFLAKSKLNRLIKKIQPDLIHTQGLRADSIAASLKIQTPWIMTSRNFPPEDYLSKFGLLKGRLMVSQHFSAMKKCNHVVSCSVTIKQKLAKVGIESSAIQNGVVLPEITEEIIPEFQNYAKPIYISVGSLIPRKNMSLIVNSFQKMASKNRGTLIILGDGPLMSELKSRSSSDIYLLGDVSNVSEYLSNADFFVSASLSEGLPNTVLEALASGLPVILSDIDSHKEIASESDSACKIFNLNDGEESLKKAMVAAINEFDSCSRMDARRIATEVFSDEIMSKKYQVLYSNVLEMR